MKKVARLGSAIILSLSLLSISLPAAFATSPVINQYSLPSGAGPERLAIDSKGDIWFTESGTNAIGEIPAGSSTSVTANQFALPISTNPYGINIDASGNVWFAENGTNQIGELTAADIAANPSGSATTTLANQFDLPTSTAPWGITNDSSGDIWFTENGTNQIGELTAADISSNPSGSTTTTLANQFDIPNGTDPIGIIADTSSNIWFAESNTNQIGELTAADISGNPSGSTTTTLANQFDMPSGSAPNRLAMSSGGNLWIAETDDQIGELTAADISSNPSGSTTTTLANQFAVPTGASPFGIAIDASGNVWFTGSADNQVGELTAADISANPAGSATTTLATEFTLPSGSNPYGVVVDASGNIWIAESGTDQIAEIDFSPPAAAAAATTVAPKTPDTGLALIAAHPIQTLAISVLATVMLLVIASRMKKPQARETIER